MPEISNPAADALAHLARAYGAPPAAARIRIEVDDFQVEEDLGFEPDGEGTHAWLVIRKRNLNTDDVARRITRFAGVRPVDVGFAGLKDRRAVTTQWFSVNLSGRQEPDWTGVQDDGLQIVHATRHGRKLRRGTLKGNRFIIVARALRGDRDALCQRLERIAARGVPNYFGAQRFGRDGRNIHLAGEMLAGRLKVRDRNKRGLYLSSARSYLFNTVLSRRVADGTWDQPLAGDVFVLAGSRSVFQADAVDGELQRRVESMDVHPSGPLWGRGELATTADAGELEVDALAAHVDLMTGLENAGLNQERRPLRLVVDALSGSFEAEDRLTLRFGLPAGSYATAVLRELMDTTEGPMPARL